MARSRMSILKRQRELKKAEKARLKRAKRHGGGGEDTSVEPQPTVRLSELGMKKADEDDKPDP